MPRQYKRKSEQKYTLETLKIAVKRLKDKEITLRQAEAKYCVPRTTLYDCLKKTTLSFPKKGNKPVFTADEENQLVQFILSSYKISNDITIPTLRKLAFEFATANNIKHNFNKSTGMAGIDWYYGFMSRHPNIKLKRPDPDSSKQDILNTSIANSFEILEEQLLTKVKKKNVNKTSNNNDCQEVKDNSVNIKKEFDYYCIFCQEKYSDPPTEGWVMCVKCHNWAHETCADVKLTKDFICDQCK